MRPTALLFLLAACSLDGPPRGFAWPTASFFRSEPATFGGFTTSSIANNTTKELVLQPAWGSGQRLGYYVTEIWQNHPDLWVQPVYLLGAVQNETIFGVDTESTFYSPFWRAWVVTAQAGKTYDRVSAVNELPMWRGPMVVCPIVPSGVTTDRAGAASRGVAFVNGARVDYLSFGTDRQIAEPFEGGDLDGVVLPADFHLFATRGADGGTEPLRELPAVLPDDPWHHAYVRRVDVLLGAEAVFVPLGDTVLRAKLTALGVQAPEPSNLIDASLAEQHRGHVAADGACFADAAGFPSTCQWLDSEGSVKQLADNRRVATDVTLTANPVTVP
ncbi:MAG: hypothetical protein JNK82_12035 [Myxococcaceae bacterium]|nr:hypothetical protein [Myxococcaceae bacterium]